MMNDNINILNEKYDKLVELNNNNENAVVKTIESYNDDPFNINEKVVYCKLINKLLANDIEAKEKLPVYPDTNEIFNKLNDGIILSKLINIAFPDTVDERVINKVPRMTREDRLKNLNLCINSAKSIDCIIDITAEDILDKKRQKNLDLLYQILKIIILKKISFQYFPQLLRLKEDKEKDEELLTLGPEDFLKRWF